MNGRARRVTRLLGHLHNNTKLQWQRIDLVVVTCTGWSCVRYLSRVPRTYHALILSTVVAVDCRLSASGQITRTGCAVAPPATRWQCDESHNGTVQARHTGEADGEKGSRLAVPDGIKLGDRPPLAPQRATGFLIDLSSDVVEVTDSQTNKQASLSVSLCCATYTRLTARCHGNRFFAFRSRDLY